MSQIAQLKIQATWDKYMQIEEESDGGDVPNEIKISSKSSNFKNTMNFALNILQDQNEDKLVLKATGQSMLKIVKLAEILKRKVAGLHQLNEVNRFTEEKTYVPLEEGLDTVKLKKEITML